jgi:hypothetical protein
MDEILVGDGRHIFMKRIQYLAYNRLDLVLDFQCQKHEAIHGIYGVLRKDLGPYCMSITKCSIF